MPPVSPRTAWDALGGATATGRSAGLLSRVGFSNRSTLSSSRPGSNPNSFLLPEAPAESNPSSVGEDPAQGWVVWAPQGKSQWLGGQNSLLGAGTPCACQGGCRQGTLSPSAQMPRPLVEAGRQAEPSLLPCQGSG